MPTPVHTEDNTVTRLCRRCGETKPLTAEFFRLTAFKPHSYSRGLAMCRLCRLEYEKKRKATKRTPDWQPVRRVSPNVNNGLRTCTRCGVSKPNTVEFFVVVKARHGRPGSTCRDCKKTISAERPYTDHDRERNKRRYRKNPEDNRRKLLKKKFGISLEMYNEMLHRQGGGCAICGATFSHTTKGVKYALAVDHNHTTGRIRELLCRACNLTIGVCREDSSRLIKAAEYLLRQQKNESLPPSSVATSCEGAVS